MKRLKIQLGILIVALTGLSAGYGISGGAGQGAGDNVIVNQVTEDDLLIAGRNLQVQAEVKGDVTAAGSDVTIAGPVAGYVMVAGARVNVNGPVGNDLWVAGANVNVNAPIADNAMIQARSAYLDVFGEIGKRAGLPSTAAIVNIAPYERGEGSKRITHYSIFENQPRSPESSHRCDDQ
jgi:hypothetical protein